MRISTPWFSGIDRRRPLNEYPRPAAVRDSWLNLNGSWQCRFAPAADLAGGDSGDDWCDILVPFSPETALSGVDRVLRPDEVLVYRRSFRIPGDWAGRRILLNFEAVDYECRCLVNGRLAGGHIGGYLPFSFDITDFLTDGENDLRLEAADPTDTGSQARGKQALEPEGIWYTPTSGIWQTVWLEPVNPVNHILDFRLTPDPENGRLTARVETAEPAEVRIRRTGAPWRMDGGGPESGTFGGQAVTGASGTDLTMNLPPDLAAWSPESPALHRLVIELLGGGGVADSMESYFALRTVSKVRGADGRSRLALNGKPVFLNAPLDQGYWPESGLTAPCEQALLFDLEKTKELGFNAVRKHTKVECRRWYSHADRLGLMVIQDMVSGGGIVLSVPEALMAFRFGNGRRDDTPRAYRRAGRAGAGDRAAAEAEMHAVRNHLHNHPSILVWVPFNEGWGQFDAARIASEFAGGDPARLVDHASGWFDRGAGDFLSRHTYVLPLAGPGKPGGRVFFLSEFGGYNLAVPGNMWDEKKRFGYRFFSSSEKLERAYARLIRTQLIPLIAEGLSAAVYTQFCDVEIESNGFFTYDRRVLKMDPGLIGELNSEIEAAYIAAWEKHHG